jgi:hypothetical protein
MPETKVVQYVTECEGLEPGTADEYDQFMTDLAGVSGPPQGSPSESAHYTMTSFGPVNGRKAVDLLNQQSIYHAFSRAAVAKPASPDDVEAYLTNRYSSGVFIGVMIDTGAATRSTAGESQFQALQRIKDVRLDKSRAGEANITFGIGQTSSLGTVNVGTPVGQITFHVVPADVLFLFCLADIDRLRVKFDNLENVII